MSACTIPATTHAKIEAKQTGDRLLALIRDARTMEEAQQWGFVAAHLLLKAMNDGGIAVDVIKSALSGG